MALSPEAYALLVWEHRTDEAKCRVPSCGSTDLLDGRGVSVCATCGVVQGVLTGVSMQHRDRLTSHQAEDLLPSTLAKVDTDRVSGYIRRVNHDSGMRQTNESLGRQRLRALANMCPMSKHLLPEAEDLWTRWCRFKHTLAQDYEEYKDQQRHRRWYGPRPSDSTPREHPQRAPDAGRHRNVETVEAPAVWLYVLQSHGCPYQLPDVCRLADTTPVALRNRLHNLVRELDLPSPNRFEIMLGYALRLVRVLELDKQAHRDIPLLVALAAMSSRDQDHDPHASATTDEASPRSRRDSPMPVRLYNLDVAGAAFLAVWVQDMADRRSVQQNGSTRRLRKYRSCSYQTRAQSGVVRNKRGRRLAVDLSLGLQSPLPSGTSPASPAPRRRRDVGDPPPLPSLSMIHEASAVTLSLPTLGSYIRRVRQLVPLARRTEMIYEVVKRS